MAQNYKYIDTMGKERVVSAGSSEEALRSAPNIGRTSGVQLMSQPVSVEKLGQEQALSAPPMRPETQSASLMSFLSPNQVVDPTTEQARQTTQGMVDSSREKETSQFALKSYIDSLLGRQTQAELEDKYMGEADTARKELNDIQDQMRRLDLASRREQEEIRQNFQGTTTGLSQVLSSVQRQAASQMADLAIVEQAKLSNYSLMADIAERKIRMETERENNQIETLKFLYSEAKDDFDKKEEREWQMFIDERERSLDEQKQEKKTLSDTKLSILQTAAGQGAPANVLSAIQRAETPEDAITAAGQWGGDVLGQQLSRQKLAGGAAGGTADAPLYANLNSATATAVRQQVGAFKTEPIVTNFATIQEGRNFAQSISTDTKNPADDQALIYSLAKALDPGSVVREGEYATAQKYAQSWVKAYGRGVTQAITGTGFLSKEARANIKKTIEGKYQSSERSYDNLLSQYTSGINNLTGRSDGDKFLRDYKVQSQSSTVATEPETQEEAIFLDTVENTGGYWAGLWKSIIGK